MTQGSAPAIGGFHVGWFMLIMLISGALNTILMKFMVMQKVPTSPGAEGEGFEQPYFQTLLMMVGEFLCLIYFYCSSGFKDQSLKFEEVPKSIFAVACLFDWTATTLVNMAYVCIPASVVQMTRGAIVIFTCVLSVFFLGRRQFKYHIVGVGFVALGITLVSLSTFFNPAQGVSGGMTASGWTKLFGISLCLGAQVFQASMLVYEERIMSKYTVPPLLVVGMEGTFGIIFGIVLLAFLNAMKYESTPGAIYQITHSTPLLCAVIGSIFSIAFFNFSGVTVTQKASAVSRSTIDVSRTILIWAVELSMGWNSFNMLQLAGFFVLALGTMIYNRLITFSFLDTPESLAETTAILKDKQYSKALDIEASTAGPPASKKL